jgi:hypothetical protein
MFGEFMFVSGATCILAMLEKVLEESDKNKHAKYLGAATKVGLGIYILKQVNQVVKEASNFL